MSKPESSLQPFSDTTHIVGQGLAELDLEVSESRASTASVIRHLLDKHEESAAGMAATQAQRWVISKISARQDQNRDVLERIFGKSAEKKREEQEQREQWAALAGGIAYFTAKGASYLVDWYLAEHEKRELGRSLFRLASFSSAATEGLSKSAQARITKICTQAGIAPSTYSDEEVPHSATALNPLDLDEEARDAVGYTCFAVAADQNGLDVVRDSTSEPYRRLKDVLALLDFPCSEQDDYRSDWAEIYQEEREHLSAFVGIATGLISGVQFRMDGRHAQKVIVEQATEIAQYNPYEERRKQQIRVVREKVKKYGPHAASAVRFYLDWKKEGIRPAIEGLATKTALAISLRHASNEGEDKQMILETVEELLKEKGVESGRVQRLVKEAKSMATLP
jgi:hypothetical protein